MSKIKHEIKIKGNAHAIYQALTTLEGLKSWHSAQTEGDFSLHSELIMKGINKPTFCWKIITLNPNHCVEWECVYGPGNAPGTKVSFNLSQADEERVLVECTHEGWSKTDGNYTKCNTLWGMLIVHLKQFVETGIAKPSFN